MPISVVCQCGAKLNAKDELAGRSVKCPKCSQSIKIPAAGSATSASPAKPTSAKPSAPAKPSTPAKTAAPAKTPAPKAPKPAPADSLGGLLDEMGVQSAPIKHDIACPKCGAGMKEGHVLCIACGYNTKTGKQTASVTDSAAIAKREAYFEQQAAKAEAQQAKILGSGAVTSSGAKVKKPEADLSGLDILFCIFCGGIALIVSIIYCVTGNPKGPAMLKITLIVQFIAFVIGVVAQLVIISQMPTQ